MPLPTVAGAAVGVALVDGASADEDEVAVPVELVPVELVPVDVGAPEDEVGAPEDVGCASLVDSTASSGPITRECPATMSFEPPTVAWRAVHGVTETSESSWAPWFTIVRVSAGVAPAG